jgi:hypothetical protein
MKYLALIKIIMSGMLLINQNRKNLAVSSSAPGYGKSSAPCRDTRLVELLPVLTEDGEYCLINFTRALEDTIIEDRSSLEMSLRGMITSATYLSFYHEDIENRHILDFFGK